MTTAAATTDTTSMSIVDLFKNSKPRTKLFVQMIPPGFVEDDFKDLIKDYESEIDYFTFKPGKIIRDSYGHLIGSDFPNYGFAVLNFKNARTCPKFHREFHQYQLSDTYNIQSKLFVEFALIQDTPNPKPTDDMTTRDTSDFRDLAVFKEFLKVFPFAAKAEEDRLSSMAPVSINLDEDDDDNEPEIQVTSPKSNPLDIKLPAIQVFEAPKLTFSSFEKKKSTEAVTPLTEYIKELSLNRELPPAQKNVENSKEISKASNYEIVENVQSKTKGKKTKKKKDKQKDKSHEKTSMSKDHKGANANTNNTNGNGNDPAKKQVKSKSSTKKSSNTGSLVEKPAQSLEIKGTPKILGRKQPQIQASEEVKPQVCSDGSVGKVLPETRKAVLKTNNPKKPFKDLTPLEVITPDPNRSSNRPAYVLGQYIYPPNPKSSHESEKSTTLPQKSKPISEKSRPAREPYVCPEEAKVILEKSDIKTEEVPVKKTFKTKQQQPSQMNSQEAATTLKTKIKTPSSKDQKSKEPQTGADNKKKVVFKTLSSGVKSQDKDL